METGGNSAGRPEERRAGPRYPIDEDSVLFFTGDGMPTAGKLVDLSQDGCRLRTSVQAPTRPWFPVEVFFQIQGEAFRFSGIVHWVSGGNQLGIRFVNMVPDRMVALAQVICALEAATQARKASAPTVEEETPEAARWRAGRQH
jgi:hypothetical protein